jgi:hypothetical protein
MDEFRLWWAATLRSLAAWLAALWQRLSYGLMHEWDVGYLVLGFGIILITGLFLVWRRKA